MIVVDTSALIAILQNEAAADACAERLIETDAVLIAAPTLTEALIVSSGKGHKAGLEELLARIAVEVTPWDENLARLAALAHARYGKGIHPARLNYGDSFSYALARELNCALLFVGNDFSQTDITPAI